MTRKKRRLNPTEESDIVEIPSTRTDEQISSNNNTTTQFRDLIECPSQNLEIQENTTYTESTITQTNSQNHLTRIRDFIWPVTHMSNLLLTSNDQQNSFNEDNDIRSLDIEESRSTENTDVESNTTNWRNFGSIQFSIFIPDRNEEMIYDIYFDYDPSIIIGSFGLFLDYIKRMFSVLSKNDLSKIKEYKITDLGENTECTICMESLLKDQIVKELNCRHVFHSDCIGRWLVNYNDKCPICRCDAIGRKNVSNK